ncbi:hypothetical protein [uncultured Psychroserpens sp.]|uniref:hypothetical protein n=1 Tax=uncultured Psychroserpens sp. TaxID=255436 RepID=UPI0026282391|nr:hypothetical protein [uncultured Psychroserpens sp.]
MNKYFFTLLCLAIFSLNTNTYSQSKSDKEKERIERETEERKNKHIKAVVDGIDLDDFQKEIVTQKLNSYYIELFKIYKLQIPSFKKKELINDLDAVHFEELKSMIGEEKVDQILEGAKDTNTNKKDKKKKKKRKKKDEN